MARIAILGATGSLGRHLLEQALAAGHQLTAVVRTPSKLPQALVPRIDVREANLLVLQPHELAPLLAGHDAVVNAAGFVTDGEIFTSLVDRVACALEALPAAERPVSWFMGGAAALQIGASSRRGLDLPRIGGTYWPHGVNHARLARSALDWRLLCPGPMVEAPAVGLARMRVALDRLPVEVPAIARVLPTPLLLPFFAKWIPQMIVSYADAASLVLSHLSHGDAISRHRVGLALPVGMVGHKEQWMAQRKPAAA